MARSRWKATHLSLGSIRTLAHLQFSRKKQSSVLVWSRQAFVTPGMLGLTIEVHDGQKHVPVYITDNKVGYRLGQFVPTRTFRSHLKKDKRGKR